jgi:dihydrofolate synthase/folylpolyglutamate synthase
LKSKNAMTYQETIDYIYSQLPMFHREGKTAYKANLDNILKLAAKLGNPQNNFKSIHIAGTNGKGSVSHMLASVLQEQGYKTGLFTSPHLIDFRERIKINGEMIPESTVISFIEKYKTYLDEILPSFFEMTTAMAFEYFAEKGVEIAVIETGLGGRLDSTNIITPLVSGITNISFDHTDILGDTLEKIAGEKAGIIKEGIPVVIGESLPETKPVFQQKASNCNSKIIFAEDCYKSIHSEINDRKHVITLKNLNKSTEEKFTLDLLGDYHEKNICTKA